VGAYTFTVTAIGGALSVYTPNPTTRATTTVAPTTVAPTTVAPTTVAPTTVAPTTEAATTEATTTEAATTEATTTAAPSFSLTWRNRTQFQVPTAQAINWNAVASDQTGQYLVGVAGSDIWTSQNYGVRWVNRTELYDPITNPKEYLLYGVASDLSGINLAAAEFGGNVLTSTDRGITWSRDVGPGSHLWTGIASSGDGSVLAVCDLSGSIWLNNKGWTDICDSTYEWRGIACSQDGSVIVVCAFGGVWSYNGIWSKVSDSTGDSLLWTSVACDSTGAYIIACAAGGGIWELNNKIWTNIDSTGSDWTSVTSSYDGTHRIAVAGDFVRILSQSYRDTYVDGSYTIDNCNVIVIQGGAYTPGLITGGTVVGGV